MRFHLFGLVVGACLHALRGGEDPEGLATPRHGQPSRRIQCWQQLGLMQEAAREVQQWQVKEPESIEALGYAAILGAQHADPTELARLLERFEEAEPNARLHDHVLEELAWATLEAASRQGTIHQRAAALLGQMATQDTRALPALHRALADPSPIMRALAAQMTPMCWDLQTSLLLEELLLKERQPDVRVALIRALGRCGTPRALEALMQAEHVGDAQEQLAALEAVSTHLGEISPMMVQRCAQHKRAGMRALGAHLALHLPAPAALSTLIGLLQDPQAMVRGSAWQALSQFNLSRADWRKLQPRWQSIGQETDRGIRALASSLALRHAPDEAMPVLRLALNAMGQADRLKTIGAVLRSGPAGLPLLEEIAEHHGDRYMRINARIGCLMHRQQPALHLERLQEELAELNERIMPLQQSSGLLAIGPSEVGHFPGIPNLPEAMDLMARLRLAHLIRACGGRLPVEQITSWLEERRWGLSAAAAQLLVSEGDAAAAQVVRDMLQHSSPRVRFQAAMVLAVVARDEAALDDLVEAAHSQDPEIELQVVGAAGSLASRKLLPFLVRKLADPSPQMRLQAASSILQILNEVSRV